MSEDLKLIKKDEKYWWWQVYTYEYKGYTIEEVYFTEEDCEHHHATVLLNSKEQVQFNWDKCMDKAMEFIDKSIYVSDGNIYFTTKIQIPTSCGDQSFEEVECEFEMSYKDFSAWLIHQTRYLEILKIINSELYYKFFDENGDWKHYKPNNQELFDLVINCVDNHRDIDRIPEFYHWSQKYAQDKYDRSR